jgi:hypothetical protein
VHLEDGPDLVGAALGDGPVVAQDGLVLGQAAQFGAVALDLFGAEKLLDRQEALLVERGEGVGADGPVIRAAVHDGVRAVEQGGFAGLAGGIGIPGSGAGVLDHVMPPQ